MTDEKRQSARHPLEWPADYRCAGAPGWRRCRLIDIAESGAAIEAFEVEDDETFDGLVELQLRAPPDIGEFMRLHGDRAVLDA